MFKNSTKNCFKSYLAACYLPSFDVGIVSDEFTLRDLNVITGAKMMVVGSTIDDVITVQSPSPVKPDNIKTNFSGMFCYTYSLCNARCSLVNG